MSSTKILINLRIMLLMYVTCAQKFRPGFAFFIQIGTFGVMEKNAYYSSYSTAGATALIRKSVLSPRLKRPLSIAFTKNIPMLNSPPLVSR